MNRYVEKELVKIAKEQDVCDILLRDGVPLVLRNGVYRHREHDSLVITPGRGFYWFSQDFGSRSPIDYYKKVEGMDFIEATYKVLEVMNYDYERKNVVISKATYDNTNFVSQEFSLPEQESHNKNVYAYLTKTRKIAPEIVNDLIKKGQLYQSKNHANAVFVGKDYEGNIVSAFKRSTKTLVKDNSWIRGDHAGSKKDFRLRIENHTNKTVNVFESEIDMLSYLTMQPALARNENYVALGGVSDRAVIEFLKHNAIEHINICTDNDMAGKEFCKELADKVGKEYRLTRELPVTKDFNQDLVEGKPYVRSRLEVLIFEEETKELSRKEKLNIINEKFSKEYQGKLVNFDYPDTVEFQDLNKAANINKFTREHYKHKDMLESRAAYNNRLNIGVEQSLPLFLEDAKYIKSSAEEKAEQNSTHKNTKQWHYFEKNIVIDNDVCTLLLDIREDFKNNTYIHKIRLRELEVEREHEKNGKFSQISQNDGDFKCEQPPLITYDDTMSNEKSQAFYERDEELGFFSKRDDKKFEF